MLTRQYSALLLCCAVFAVPCSSLEGNTPPNILLILADDVGSDVPGCYGGQSYPTPHLDALASTGIKFNHAYAMPVCHPSRICLMTGRYPFRFGKAGMRWGDFPAEAEADTMAQLLRRAGYATAVAGKWQLCLMKDDVQHARRLGFEQSCLFGWHEGARYHHPLIYQNGQLVQHTEGAFGPDIYVDFLVDFMDRCAAKRQPFFAYYPMALCHDVTDDLAGRQVPYYKHGRWMTYAEMVVCMDDMVGRLIEELNRLSIRNNTLVLFMTDNGTAGASYLYVDDQGQMVRTANVSVRHGQVVPGGKGKQDDTGTRVPLIASWPGTVPAGQQSDDLVDLTDFLPTLLDVADAAEVQRPRMDGISFAPLLKGQKGSRKREWIFTEHRGSRSVRSQEWRLFDDGRLFHVERDPRQQQAVEQEGLSGDAQQAARQLQQVLDKLR